MECGSYVILFIHSISHLGLKDFTKFLYNRFTFKKRELMYNDKYVTRYYFKYLSKSNCSQWKTGDLSIYIPWPFPPVWGVADNTKETTKTIGVSLRSSSNDEGSSRVWMALLEQHSPSSPIFHNLRRFIDAVSPTAPTTGLPLQGNPVATADANQNCVTIIRHSFLFLARSLASLISILLSFRALFAPSIHPNLGLPLAFLPSTFAFITFFSSHSLSILST